MEIKSKLKVESGKLKAVKPQVRLLKEMKKVVFDKDFAEKNPDLELYYMYRGIKKKDSLRYDITVVPPKMLGKEFVRTKGNQNSENFQELYNVLSGKAIFLVQKAVKNIVEDVFFVKAKKGEWVKIPPKYAVVMINPQKKTLKTANWISNENENIYKELEKMKGACYFFTKSGWIKNKNYKKIPSLYRKFPLKNKPKNLDFLK